MYLHMRVCMYVCKSTHAISIPQVPKALRELTGGAVATLVPSSTPGQLLPIMPQDGMPEPSRGAFLILRILGFPCIVR